MIMIILNLKHSPKIKAKASSANFAFLIWKYTYNMERPAHIRRSVGNYFAMPFSFSVFPKSGNILQDVRSWLLLSLIRPPSQPIACHSDKLFKLPLNVLIEAVKRSWDKCIDLIAVVGCDHYLKSSFSEALCLWMPIAEDKLTVEGEGLHVVPDQPLLDVLRQDPSSRMRLFTCSEQTHWD